MDDVQVLIGQFVDPLQTMENHKPNKTIVYVDHQNYHPIYLDDHFQPFQYNGHVFDQECQALK